MPILGHLARPSPSPAQPKPPLHQALFDKLRHLQAQSGYWLASHQILSLLVASLLIATLLTPALLLYLSPFSSPASSILRRVRGQLPWELDGLQQQGLLWSEDNVCWDTIAGHLAEGHGASAAAVVAEQVLVGPAGSDGGEAVSKELLHKAWRVERELERRLLSGELKGLSCVVGGGSGGDGGCAISSPTKWWSTEGDLLGDTDLHKTLSAPHPPSSLNLTFSLPLTLASTLVAPVRDRHGHLRGADFLAITFYLQLDPMPHSALNIASAIDENSFVYEPRTRDNARQVWRQAVREVVGGKGWPTRQAQLGKMSPSEGQGQRVIVKHLPSLPVQANPRQLEDAIFILCYLLVGVYVYWSIRDAAVHSKIGLVFTACVELAASGIMSLSVCWLLGISVGLVPWKLIPFLVTVCGVDSMNILVNAVASTPLSQPIPERIASAFYDVGPSMLATLVAELFVAGSIIAYTTPVVWKEITSFTVVVLIVDFVLEGIFFTPVLSIDIQRFELADLIRQNPNQPLPSTPSDLGDKHGRDDEPDALSLEDVVRATVRELKARPARIATFATLIGINIALYSQFGPSHYLPAFCSETALSAHPHPLSPALSSDLASALRRGQRGHHLSGPQEIGPGAGAAFWSLLNPTNASSVRIYVEPVTAVSFFTDSTAAPESVSPTRIGRTSTLAKVTVVLGPIAVTLAVVYLLLLYLLKDAELLAVKRLYFKQARQEAKKVRAPLGAGVELAQLRGRHAADVELLASSKGAIVSWAGLDDQLVLWRVRGNGAFESDSLQLPLTAGPASLVHLALDADSNFCAAATITGRVLVWALDRRLLIDFSPGKGSADVAGFGPATALVASRSQRPHEPTRKGPRPVSASPAPGPSPQAFFTVHVRGEVVMYDCVACTYSVLLGPADTKVRTFVAPPAAGLLPPILVRAQSGGKVRAYRLEAGHANASLAIALEAQLAADDVLTAVGFGELVLGSGSEPAAPSQAVLALGSLSGAVSLHDVTSGRRLCTVAELDGPVRQIRLASMPKGLCPSCAEPFGDGVQVACATRQIVTAVRVSLAASSAAAVGSSVCACATAGLHRNSSVSSLASFATPRKHRRRASSNRSAAPNDDGSPVATPPRPPRSPRASLALPDLDAEEDQVLLAPAPLTLGVPLFSPRVDAPASGDGTSVQSQTLELACVAVASARTDERGGWDVLDGALVGVRRRRAIGPARAPGGTMWEVWSVPLTPASFGHGAGDKIGTEGATPLDALLSQTAAIEQADAALPFPPHPSPSPHYPTTLRRRLAAPSAPAVGTPLRLATPSIRFEDVVLPFSRARPVVAALGGAAAAVGLGNSVAVLSAAGTGQRARGQHGRWASGGLGVPAAG